MTDAKQTAADLLSFARAAHGAASPAVQASWQAVLDRLDSLAFGVRQAVRAGRPVPALDAVVAAVHAKVGGADTATHELDAVLAVLEAS
jgi:hypothetical protein